MVQQGTVYRYPALLAVFFILFRNNRYAPDKQTINGILTVHKQSISVPHNKISNMGTRKNDKNDRRVAASDVYKRQSDYWEIVQKQCECPN